MKRKLFAILLSLVLLCVLAVSATAHPARLVDSADLLSDVEEEVLMAKLDEISNRQNFDVVIVTVDSLNGKSAMAYADDFYDYNGYGMGSGKDGALLLLSMEERDWHVTTTGFGITAITDAGLEYMADEFLIYISDGMYMDGFTSFAEQCDDYVRQAHTGKPYDVGNLPREVSTLILFLVIALVIGFVIAGISVLVMKAQLRSVRAQGSASDYTKSMQLSDSREIFLYRRVERRERPKPDSGSSGGGGSTTHRSSSGTSHGGGGGKF